MSLINKNSLWINRRIDTIWKDIPEDPRETIAEIKNILRQDIGEILSYWDDQNLDPFIQKELEWYGIEEGMIEWWGQCISVIDFLRSISVNFSDLYTYIDINHLEYRDKSWVVDCKKNRWIKNDTHFELSEGIFFYDQESEEWEIGYIKLHLSSDEYIYMDFKRKEGSSGTQDQLKSDVLSCYNTFSRYENEIILQAQSINHQYTHPLTSLLNKDFWIKLLNNREKENGHNYSLIFFDIADFKNINSTFGHNVWDEILKAFATILKEMMRAEDYVLCLWWDEFWIIVDNWENNTEAMKKLLSTLIDRINVKLEEINILQIALDKSGISYNENNQSHQIQISIAGHYALSTSEESKKLEELTRKADEGLVKGEDGIRHRAEETVSEKLWLESLTKFINNIFSTQKVYEVVFFSLFKHLGKLQKLVKNMKEDWEIGKKHWFNHKQAKVIQNIAESIVSGEDEK